MSQRLFYSLLLAGAGLVLYLSWRAMPEMSTVWFVPSWLAHWADESQNAALRTAVPFGPLGVLAGAQLAWQQRPWPQWLAAWAALVGLAAVAETGQLLLSHRTFQWLDIGWGAVGALAGLALVAIGKEAYLATQKLGGAPD